MTDRIKISKKSTIRGDDGHKIISVRLTNELLGHLDSVAVHSNRSRNEVINLLLESAVSIVEIEGQEQEE